MYNSIKNLFVSASLALLVSCSTPQEMVSIVGVSKTDSITDATSQSLTYTLPKTVVKVEIETEKVIKKAGPYYRYSQRFLNLSNVITEDSEEWVIKNVRVYTEGVSDASKRYSIDASGNTSAWNINLTKDGVIRGFNNPITQSTSTKKTCSTNIPNISDITFNDVELSEDILLKTSSASMAQETANMVYQIRANRFNMLSGNIDNIPADGQAYQLMLGRFDQMEQEFVQLFAGKTIKANKTETYSYTPSKEGGNSVLCRFSKSKGIVDAMDLSGTPIYIKVNIEEFAPLQNNSIINPKDKPKRQGIYYCLPGEASIEILDKNIELLTQQVKIAQYGQVVSMPASIVEKEGTIVKICTATGALIEIADK